MHQPTNDRGQVTPKKTFAKVSRAFGRPLENEKIQVIQAVTPLKTNMDTQNDGLERVTPFKHGNF